MRWFITSCFIKIYTVWHSVSDFRLKPLFASVDKSKFKNGRFHFWNSGMKGLKPFTIIVSNVSGNISGAELREIQKQIDSLTHPTSPRTVAEFMTLRRDVMFLEFDTAVRHSMADTFLSTGNVQAYQVHTVYIALDEGPVVQSIISLMSLLVVKMLTVLVSKISNSQVFLLKKCE